MHNRQVDAALRKVESVNDRVRQARELTERRNDSNPEKVGRFIEAYLGGELKLGLRYTLGEPPEYGFTLSAIRGSDRKGLKVSCVRNAESCGKDVNGEQSLMLSVNVEQMESMQASIPSLVRLQRYEDVSFLDGEGLYEFVPFVTPGEKDFLTSRNRKVRIVNKRWAVAAGERGSQNIQAASNGVEVGTGFDIEGEWVFR